MGWVFGGSAVILSASLHQPINRSDKVSPVWHVRVFLCPRAFIHTNGLHNSAVFFLFGQTRFFAMGNFWNPAVSSVWETKINKEENAEWSVPPGVIQSSLEFSVLPKDSWITDPKVRGLYDWRHSHPRETVLSASIRWQPATLLILLRPALLIWAESQSLCLKLYDSLCLTEKWDLSCHFIRIDNGEKKKGRLWREKKSPCHLLTSD